MAGEYPERPFGDLVQNFDRRRIPLSSRERSKRRGAFPYYGATGIMDYVDDYLFEGLHLLVAEDGSVERPDGKPFLQLVNGRFWVNNHAHVLRGGTDEDTRFLYYALSTVPVRPFMSGSVQAKLSQGNLNRIPTPYPDEPVRSAISHILGTLDDKIELNRRTNETLEAIARALFKSWFVDFDPVYAKAAGLDLNLPAEIAGLFSDSFGESEVGPIPKGWTPGKLADVADNPRRTVKPSDVPPATPYMGLQHMPRRSIALDAWGRADEVGSGKSQFKECEILFGKLRPYFHKVGIAPVDGVCSTDILVVVPKSSEWHSYVLSLMSSKAFVDYTDSHSAGTKMPRTNWKDIGRYPLALPPETLAKAFQDHVAALHQRIGLAVRQNRRLAGLRDTLLPKLLSGEIVLPEAEALVEGGI